MIVAEKITETGKRKILLTPPVGWERRFYWIGLGAKMKGIFSPFSISPESSIYGLDFLSANLKTDHLLLKRPTWKRLSKLLKYGDFTDVGISYLINHLDLVRETVEKVREISKNVKIWGGGHGVFSFPDFADRLFDGACVGWGVEWLKEKLGEPISNAPYRLPVSDINLTLRFSKLPILRLKIGNVVANVGCPKGCDFCQITKEYGGIIRVATPEQVVRHMKENRRRMYVFQDDNFFLHKRWIEDFFLEREKVGEKTPWYVWGSIDLMRNYDIGDLVENGFRGVFIGYERSDHPKSKEAEEITKELQNNGILIQGSFILGWKDQSEQDVEREIEWALSLKCDSYFFAIYMPLPRVSKGYELLENDPEKWVKNYKIGSGEMLSWKHPTLSKEWLEEKLRESYKRTSIDLKSVLKKSKYFGSQG